MAKQTLSKTKEVKKNPYNIKKPLGSRQALKQVKTAVKQAKLVESVKSTSQNRKTSKAFPLAPCFPPVVKRGVELVVPPPVLLSSSQKHWKDVISVEENGLPPLAGDINVKKEEELVYVANTEKDAKNFVTPTRPSQKKEVIPVSGNRGVQRKGDELQDVARNEFEKSMSGTDQFEKLWDKQSKLGDERLICWLCGFPICSNKEKGEAEDKYGAIFMDRTLVSFEGEHVLACKTGWCLLGLASDENYKDLKLLKERNAREKLMRLELLPSHRYCNQVKSELHFVSWGKDSISKGRKLVEREKALEWYLQACLNGIESESRFYLYPKSQVYYRGEVYDTPIRYFIDTLITGGSHMNKRKKWLERRFEFISQTIEGICDIVNSYQNPHSKYLERMKEGNKKSTGFYKLTNNSYDTINSVYSSFKMVDESKTEPEIYEASKDNMEDSEFWFDKSGKWFDKLPANRVERKKALTQGIRDAKERWKENKKKKTKKEREANPFTQK